MISFRRVDQRWFFVHYNIIYGSQKMFLILAAIAIVCVLVLLVSHVYYMVYDLQYLDEYCKHTFAALDDGASKSTLNKSTDVSTVSWTLTN